MKRLAVFLTAALFAGLLALLPVTPAAADTGACAGLGTANVSGGLLYPLSVASPGSFTAPRSASFGYSLNPGVCVDTNANVLLNGASANGTVNGWCGMSEGSGFANGHVISFIGIGGLLIVTGEAVGAVIAVPNVPAGHSCSDQNSSAGASQFLILGGAASQHATDCRLRGKVTYPPPFIRKGIRCTYPVSVDFWLEVGP